MHAETDAESITVRSTDNINVNALLVNRTVPNLVNHQQRRDSAFRLG